MLMNLWWRDTCHVVTFYMRYRSVPWRRGLLSVFVCGLCWTRTNTTFSSTDGYSKLHDREDDLDDTLKVDGMDQQQASKPQPAAEQKPEPPKIQPARSHDSILMMPARLVKKAVGSATEKSSSYKQFVDADSDDPLERERDAPPPRTKPEQSVAPPTRDHPRADSSSEGHDFDPRKYQKDRDFYYQELEDEYGSKKCVKTRLDHGYEKGDSSDAGQSHDDCPDADKELLHHSINRSASPGQRISPKLPDSHPMDRIVGHEYGIRPLLDDDELSESEMNPATDDLVNPATDDLPPSARDETLDRCADHSPATSVPTTSPNIPPRSPNIPPRSPYISTTSPNRSEQTAAVDEPSVSTADPFAFAPFRLKGRSSKTPKKLSQNPRSPPVVTKGGGEDVFANAPFKSSRINSPPSSPGVVPPGKPVNHEAQVVLQQDGSVVYSHLSPNTVEMRSPSQSPERPMQTASPGGHDMMMGSGDIDMFGSGNFSQMTFNQAQVQLEQRDRQKQEQKHVQQQRQLQQQALQQHQQQQHQLQQLQVQQQQQHIQAAQHQQAAQQQQQFHATQQQQVAQQQQQASQQQIFVTQQAAQQQFAVEQGQLQLVSGSELSTQQAVYGTSPQEQYISSPSPQFLITRVAQPPSSLPLGGQGAGTQYQPSPVSGGTTPQEDGQDLFGMSLLQESDYEGHRHHMNMSASLGAIHATAIYGGVTKATARKGGLHRRGSSDSRSSGSDGKPSPRSSKKESGRIRYKSGDVTQDENVDVLTAGNYGSLKRNKQRSSKKSPREKPTTEFANLGFDDSDALDGERSESSLNLSMDSSALKASNHGNTSNYLNEGSHTLPRTQGAKKHRSLPKTPDAEPFSGKKKTSMSMFKWFSYPAYS